MVSKDLNYRHFRKKAKPKETQIKVLGIKVKRRQPNHNHCENDSSGGKVIAAKFIQI